MLKALEKIRPNLLHAASTLVLLLAFSLVISGTNNPLQRWLSDSAQRNSVADLDNAPIAIVAIDEDSQAKLGAWPWSNSLHASLIERLRSANVRAIAFTTPIEPTGSGSDPAADSLLEKAILAQGRVVLPISVSTRNLGEQNRQLQNALTRSQRHFSDGTKNRAISAYTLKSDNNRFVNAAAGLGHLLQPTDADGMVRRDYAAIKLANQLLPSLGLELANLAGDPGNSMIVTADTLQLNETAAHTELTDDLSYAPRVYNTAVPTYSYWEVLTGKVGRAQLQGRSVVVGITDGASADRISTSTGTVPRVQFVAASANSLLLATTLHHPSWAYALEWLFAAITILLTTKVYTQIKPVAAALICIGYIAALLTLDWYCIYQLSASVHVVAIALAALASFALTLTLTPAAKNKGSHGAAAISMETLKTLALTLHGQGQLDLALETLRRCEPNRDTLDLLYRLAGDYERRRDILKAAQIHRYITESDAQYKDSSAKLQQLQALIERPKPSGSTPKPMRNITKPAPVANEPVRRSSKESLGRYEIDKQIGKGAMGVVYLGRDPKINRVVAIKAIPLTEEFEDEDLAEARERFFREAEMAGRLNHPGIVTIFDAGEDHGLAYIAMEYIQGEHLSYYCEPNRLLPARKALTLIIRVAEALNYAHLNNVVHRDIKPANIMYNIDTDALKITDFGIARLSDVSRTKTGIVLGTPSFMSPEQLEGRPLDGRSDLFALGVSMYQLLTGQLPFRADSMTRLMNTIATEPHPPIRSLRPELPECIERIIDRCLAKAAEDRFQSGIELADAIRNCMRSMTP